MTYGSECLLRILGLCPVSKCPFSFLIYTSIVSFLSTSCFFYLWVLYPIHRYLSVCYSSSFSSFYFYFIKQPYFDILLSSFSKNLPNSHSSPFRFLWQKPFCFIIFFINCFPNNTLSVFSRQCPSVVGTKWRSFAKRHAVLTHFRPITRPFPSPVPAFKCRPPSPTQTFLFMRNRSRARWPAPTPALPSNRWRPGIIFGNAV